jgi:probable phosphoglycerate mutase
VNHLASAAALRNSYYLMRHGQAIPNVRGLIISDPATGTLPRYGLSAAGRRQAEAAAREAARSGLGAATLIVSSDFSRAAQTARIVRRILGAAPVIADPALRERYFGPWEGTSTAGYERVWAADAASDGLQAAGAEPAGAVLDRMTALVARLEREHCGRDILLVSHGDPLQILQAGMLRLSPAAHRTLPHLETARIRRADLAPLPRPAGT